MKSYEKILKLAIQGKLPKNISEDNFPDIDIFVELYQSGFIDAIDASSLDGKAYLNPKITFEGREYYDGLEHAPNNTMNTNKNEAKKVFISYVHENSDQVDAICKIFSEKNIIYWIDREKIEPGKLWKTAIKEAIGSGGYFLACFSSEYEKKSETHMNEEILLAIEILRKKQIDSCWFVPIKLNECNIPEYDIGTGKTLHDIQYLDFAKEWDAGLERLVDIIKREEKPTEHDIVNSFVENQYIYRGLKSLIEMGSGWGFHNGDLGHPVYRLGATDASDETLKDWEYADSPEKNYLFKMISRLSKELKQSGIEDYQFIWWDDLSEWRDFCKFVIDVYDKKRGYK